MRKFLIAGLLASLALAFVVAVPAVRAEGLGRYKIELVDGRTIEGDVTETGDGYTIKTKHGATMNIAKARVRRMTAVAGSVNTGASPADATAASPSKFPDELIDQILEGIEGAAASEDDTAIEEDNLPVDKVARDEMMKFMGSKAKKEPMLTPHFMLVYSSSTPVARQLANRLEAVYRWNVKLTRQFGLEEKKPDFKLCVYFFGHHDEFIQYNASLGTEASVGLLGFYRPDTNKSAFFDMETWPPIYRYKLAEKEARDPQTKQVLRNLVERSKTHMNLETVQHEAAHHIHFNLGFFSFDNNPPRWLVEGFATMFETPPSVSGASLGTLNNSRVDEFKTTFGRYREFPMDFKRFISDDGMWFQYGGFSYQIGWAINNYLYREKRAAFKKFVKHVSTRESGTYEPGDRIKDFEAHFGEVNEEWLKKWFEYSIALPVKPSQLPPELF